MTRLIVDVESRGLTPELGETVFAIGVADADEAPCRATLYRLSDHTDVELFSRRFREATTLIGHNLKFDLRQIYRTLGLVPNPSCVLVDTLIWARHLLSRQSVYGGYGLKVLTASMNHKLPQYQDPKKYLRSIHKLPKRGTAGHAEALARRTDYSLLPDEILNPYLASDIIRTWALFRQLSKLRGHALPATIDNIEMEMKLVPIVMDMELKGVPISADNLAEIKLGLQHQLREVLTQIPFDFQSRTELLEHFGDWLERYKFETDKGALSCDFRALKFLASRQVPYAEQIIQARQHSKLLSTYIRGWERFLKLGRIHPQFNITGPRTGRMSSDRPNLQNVPKIMRRCLVPEEGCVFVLGDYDQMEMRAAAYVSGDEGLLAAVGGRDVHTATARRLFEKESITDTERKVAKVFNFAVLYGARPRRIQKTLNTDTDRRWTVEEATDLYSKFWAAYPKFATWSSTAQRAAQRQGFMTDPLGRRQYSDPGAPYTLSNYIIQGFCAGITKRAMVQAAAAGLDIRVPVHDELVLMVRKGEEQEAGAALRGAMENVGGYKFPIKLQVGPSNWYETGDLV